MKKALLLSYGSDTDENVLMEAINQSEKVETRCVLKSVGFPFRILRRLMLDHGVSGMGIWLGNWKRELGNYGLVIVTAARYTPEVLNWIHKKEPGLRLVCYYWDKVSVSRYPVVKSLFYENWSFDRQDCEEYGFKYNAQYYSKELKLPEEQIIYDASFVGADREGTWQDRVILVGQCYRLLKECGLRCFFYLVTKNKGSDAEITYDRRLTEHEFLKVIAQSRAVVDIVQPGSEWMTLRPLLALSNGKKLITNYKGITEERFYSKDNVFILGEDDIEDLSDFVNSPFVRIPEDDLQFYEIDSWSERFGSSGIVQN